MHVVIPIVGALAALAWGSAVVHAFLLFGHRRVSGTRLVFSGISWMSRENFAPEAWGLHRRFVGSFVAFFVVVFVGALAGLAASR